ncbi:Crp/Fnr family transcriptional regulator [Alkalicoccus urumqiensis]|uniref:Crp/Fnr family transcriptional regulator n=1 Tax=Alkalicoccus urumqiensis TaxID=1548213 RepID=A0A2P6MK00_ALKUR|nr:Crp/Fnr family transcriptional regulator [Alkalicoccus urumqiensis]PRO66614.1 Crp/Fnr family transcriptional regulator [Alkalicoccus urumqiensis]
MDKMQLLSGINILEDLPVSQLKQVDAISTMKTFAPGESIAPASGGSRLYLLKSGQVRLFRAQENGREFTYDILTDGSIFGRTAQLELTDSGTTVEAMQESTVCIIEEDDFQQFLIDHPDVSMAVMQVLSERLQALIRLGEMIALRSVKYRLLYLLLHLSEKKGRRFQEWQSVDLEVTHQDLAQMIGSTRETTSATLKELMNEGYIKREKRFLRRTQHLYVHADKAGTYLHDAG